MNNNFLNPSIFSFSAQNPSNTPRTTGLYNISSDSGLNSFEQEMRTIVYYSELSGFAGPFIYGIQNEYNKTLNDVHTTNHNVTVFMTDGFPNLSNDKDPAGSKPPISILDDNHFCDTVNGVFSEHNSDFKNSIFFIPGINGNLAPYDTTFLQYCFDGFKKYDNTYQASMSGVGGDAENLYYFVLSLLGNTSTPVDKVSFYPTAVDDNRALLPQGSPDRHWVISARDNNYNVTMPPYVEDVSNYIGPNLTGESPGILGAHTYTQVINDGGYRLSFDVFSRAGASEPVHVSLNNTEISPPGSHYSVCLPNNAQNTLNFVVYHQQASVLTGIKVINVKNEGTC